MILNSLKFFALQIKASAVLKQTFYSTIYALSSGRGKCGVAVVRISGSSAFKVCREMVGLIKPPTPRKALLKYIHDPITKNNIDKGLVLWFPGPNSFTGEDCCEFQVHGSAAVIQALFSALTKIENVRPAEPGEFTRRAFYAGKMDLVEVEGLADLLQAETELQLKNALLQTDGILSKLYNDFRSEILRNLAYLEAYIDFDETETIDDNLHNKVRENVLQIIDSIESHLRQSKCGERLRTGVKTVILGKPNVGKSSLLNILTNKPTAIVTPIAGTTRDALEVCLDINGYPMVLVDTAGLRTNTEDVIEIEGINRAIKFTEHTDIVLLMVEANDIFCMIKNCFEKDVTPVLLNYVEENIFPASLKDMNILNEKPFLIVINKMDLLNAKDVEFLKSKLKYLHTNYACVSCLNTEGITDFLSKLTKHLDLICGSPSTENPIVSHARHKYHLENCLIYLKEFVNCINNDSCDIVLTAENLRSAMTQLGKITGKVSTEQLLDVIFKEFCIGK
ncbi:tRNA modification GTPase GTPBP3, mitochondrial [Chrysoperla carnea]|uniref:tRNA modification GTPase GTPBP3, mitochondrial n=1 Tax=Chrysoperla carnea TaxID=189513 RepID=UPI001D07F47D|nr:tRNA modification GTPase GTPBP3, mitochondrial [Chrysoperla carnea]